MGIIKLIEGCDWLNYHINKFNDQQLFDTKKTVGLIRNCSYTFGYRNAQGIITAEESRKYEELMAALIKRVEEELNYGL